jgi:hypothetical protein
VSIVYSIGIVNIYMQHPTLKKIDQTIEKIVERYRENPSDELYQKWINLLREYTKQAKTLKNI